MEQKKMDVVRIQPGHHLFNFYQAASGEYIFAVEVTEKEHKPGMIEATQFNNEVTYPVFSLVIHNPEQARLMAISLIELAERMEKDGCKKPIMQYADKEVMTVKQYNAVKGDNSNE